MASRDRRSTTALPVSSSPIHPWCWRAEWVFWKVSWLTKLFEHWSLQHNPFHPSINTSGPDTPDVLDEHTHTLHPLCFRHMLHFPAHSLKIICHLYFFLSLFLSLVFCWLFNRKQRQQPLGRQWKTTAMLCSQLSANVLFIAFLPFRTVKNTLSCCFLAQRKCQSKSTNLYLVCSTAANTDLCSPPSKIGFEPKSFTLSSQDITESQQLKEIKSDHGQQCGGQLDGHWLSALGREDPYQWQGIIGWSWEKALDSLSQMD